MEYQDGQPLPGHAPAGAQSPSPKRISRPQGTVPDSLLRLVSAILVEIDEKWASDTKACIKWECQDA
jgi:hypothetical protein